MQKRAVLEAKAQKKQAEICYWCGTKMQYTKRTDTYHCRRCQNCCQGAALRYLKSHPEQAL